MVILGRWENDLFMDELMFICVRGKLDGTLGGADWEAWEYCLEKAVHSIGIGITRREIFGALPKRLIP